MGRSSTLRFHPSVTSSDASIGPRGGTSTRSLSFSLLYVRLSITLTIGYVCTRGRTRPGLLNTISCIRRRGIYSFEGEPDGCEPDRPIGGSWENGFSFYIELSPSCIVRRGTLHVRREHVVRANRLIVIYRSRLQIAIYR